MGKGTSVLELVHEFEKASGRKINTFIQPERRPGDVACVICSANKANVELGWRPKYSLEEMCE